MHMKKFINRPERVVPELLEGFAPFTVLEKCAQHGFQRLWQLARHHSAEDLAANGRPPGETTADKYVIGINTLTA